MKHLLAFTLALLLTLWACKDSRNEIIHTEDLEVNPSKDSVETIFYPIDGFLVNGGKPWIKDLRDTLMSCPAIKNRIKNDSAIIMLRDSRSFESGSQIPPEVEFNKNNIQAYIMNNTKMFYRIQYNARTRKLWQVKIADGKKKMDYNCDHLDANE